MMLWRRLRSPAFALFAAAVAFGLVRARDQPGVPVSFGATSASFVPGDLLLAALFVTASATLIRRRDREPAPLLATAAIFCLLVLSTAAANGSGPFVSAVKLVELTALGLGAIALVRTDTDFEAVVDILLLFTIAACAVGIWRFAAGGGGRQASFLGEHDFAALATLPLLYGLDLAIRDTRHRRAALAIVAGGIGCVLGAALASLLGFYLGTIVLAGVAAVQHRLRLRSVLVTAIVVLCVTAGTLSLRAGALGFLQVFAGKQASHPGQYSGSWSQRLIYTYVDFRVFLDHPVLGTGWYPLLPPSRFDGYLPDTRRRFSDQPPRYLPPADRPFIPQQTFDQIPAELGVVGSAAFLAIFVLAGRATGRAIRRTALPAAWLAATVGAVAGEALFGGTPLTAVVWLILGLCAARGAARVTP
jgi:hypothetical protein